VPVSRVFTARPSLASVPPTVMAVMPAGRVARAVLSLVQVTECTAAEQGTPAGCRVVTPVRRACKANKSLHSYLSTRTSPQSYCAAFCQQEH